METASVKPIAKNPSAAGSLQKYIYSQIRSGSLKPGEKIQTAQLAKEWNISEGTVNQSLHILAARGFLVRKRRAGTFVGDSTIVLDKEREIGNALAVLMPDLRSPEFSCLTSGLQNIIKDTQFNMVAFGAEHDTSAYAKFIHEQIESNAAGIILTPPLQGMIPVESLIELYNSKIPVVTCFRGLAGFGWPVIRTDVEYNTQIAATHLCEIGRKHIGFVSNEQRSSHYGLIKEHVFIETLDKFGVSTPTSMRICLPKPDSSEQMWLFTAIAQIEEWLEKHPKMDAICCTHDMAAWAVISTLAKLGKKVPDDIAVTGNGDIMQFFGFAQSDLTTVDMCYSDFAGTILELVNRQHNGESLDKEYLVKGKLIVRHSTVSGTAKNQ
jgi:DNA-binding LacI/PurR family transcriptional regulator